MGTLHYLFYPTSNGCLFVIYKFGRNNANAAFVHMNPSEGFRTAVCGIKSTFDHIYVNHFFYVTVMCRSLFL